MTRFLVLSVLVSMTACAAVVVPAPAKTTVDSYFPGDPAFPWVEIGSSVEGRPIYALRLGTGGEATLVFGGIHGNEKPSVHVALELCRELRGTPWLLRDNRVVIVPVANPDGYVYNTRQNVNNVDLNRNFPTGNWGDATLRPRDNPGRAPASEPETRALIALVRDLRPSKIISIHSPLRVNNYDGRQSEDLARVMSALNGYPAAADIGYPTPGSFGTWAGIERAIPTVTLETPNGGDESRWKENRWALIAAIRYRAGDLGPVLPVRRADRLDKVGR